MGMQQYLSRQNASRLYYQIRPFALFRESIVLPEQAGLLTYNILAVLPVCRQWTLLAKTFFCYLQLRDSP